MGFGGEIGILGLGVELNFKWIPFWPLGMVSIFSFSRREAEGGFPDSPVLGFGFSNSGGYTDPPIKNARALF